MEKIVIDSDIFNVLSRISSFLIGVALIWFSIKRLKKVMKGLVRPG